MSYPDPEWKDPHRYHFGIAALVAIMLTALLLFAGCEPPAKTPCCPKAKTPTVRVVWFSAEWCGPCKGQAPTAKAALAGYNWNKVDVDVRPDLANHYKVRTIPTYVVLVDGTERARTGDAMELKRLLGR